MTNYNDGRIHGWNGGECPVHPETVVRVWYRGGLLHITKKPLSLSWLHDESTRDIIAIQVVKEHHEPKTIWVNEYPSCCVAYESEEHARLGNGLTPTRIAVKYVEVIE